MSLLLNNAISGLLTAQRGMDTTSHNIANVNTTRPADEEPFRAKLVHAEEALGMGFVRVFSGPLVRSSYHAWEAAEVDPDRESCGEGA